MAVIALSGALVYRVEQPKRVQDMFGSSKDGMISIINTALEKAKVSDVSGMPSSQNVHTRCS